MSLKNWKDNGWIREHRTSRQETTNLFAIVERDLSDAASTQLSADWRFGIAYNAALKLSPATQFEREKSWPMTIHRPDLGESAQTI